MLSREASDALATRALHEFKPMAPFLAPGPARVADMRNGQASSPVEALSSPAGQSSKLWRAYPLPEFRAMSHAASNLLLNHREAAAVAATSAMFFAGVFVVTWLAA